VHWPVTEFVQGISLAPSRPSCYREAQCSSDDAQSALDLLNEDNSQFNYRIRIFQMTFRI